MRLFHDLPVDQGCELELNGGARYRLERVWQRDDHAGFRFAESSIDIHHLIEEAGPFPKRHIRLRLKHPVPLLLSSNGVTLPAQMSDIAAWRSRRTRPAHGHWAAVAARRTSLSALHARVLWRRGKLHGLVFQEGFRLDALAELAGRIQLADEQDLLVCCEAPNSPAALTGD